MSNSFKSQARQDNVHFSRDALGILEQVKIYTTLLVLNF